MKIIYSVICVLALGILGFSFSIPAKDRLLEIDWQKELKGDFSFSQEWSFPEGVYTNQWGQLSCDGLCPPAVTSMKDSLGRIYNDSLSSFYAIVDTTHVAHTLLAQGSMYEWAGSNQINFERKEDGTIVGKSANNAATHTSINIRIEGDQVTAWLNYNSIYEQDRHIFPLKDGWIKMDKKLFRKGIVKARFHFDFTNTLEALVPLNCEGLIYSKIQ